MSRFDLKLTVAPEKARNYLGASSIGDPCERKIWYGLYYSNRAEPFTSNQRRTFAIGHKLESLLIEELNANGYKVTSNNKRLGQDKFYGHCDGIINLDGEEHILEIKTANNSNFNQFCKKGLRVWRDNYFSQVQAYMGFAQIPKAIIIVINKDNSQLENEIINYDDGYFQGLRYKAKKIIEADTAPKRVNESPMWYQCKMCQFKRICRDEDITSLPRKSGF